MMFAATAHVQELKRIATAESHSKMIGIQFIPARLRCGGCGKMRTAATGKQYASGLFLGDCCKPKKAK